MKEKIIGFSLSRPKTIMFLALLMTAVVLLLAAQRIIIAPDDIIDTDPENMLAENEPARVFHNLTEEKFGLFDIVALGIYYPGDNGVYIPEILKAVNDITDEIMALRENDYIIDANGDTLRVDLTFENAVEKTIDGKRVSEKVREHGIIFEDIIAPNQVEDINGETGELVIQTLMPEAPKTLAEAAEIKRRIDLNPLYSDKLAAFDGKLIGIYVPIRSKKISYALSQVLEALAHKHLGSLMVAGDAFHGEPFLGRVGHKAGEHIVAGMPVAQDAFGKFMFEQMGVSAPLAGLVIFILLFIFFKSVRVILAPMIMAVLIIIWTMSLLVGLGFTVHIMSSMIPIFLFPIAVLDSIHIISSIHKRAPQHKSLRDTIAITMRELYSPILFTSVTTVVGFVTLTLTFIPPVQVFGAFIGVGVAFAWLLSVTFLPAYLALAGEKAFARFSHEPDSEHGLLGKIAKYLRWISQHYSRAALAVSFVLFGVAIYGIAQIEINDNPVKWFKKGHPLRQASELMNDHVAGTYMANIVFDFEKVDYESYANEIDYAQLLALAQNNEIQEAFYEKSTGRFWGLVSGGEQLRTQIDADENLVEDFIRTLTEGLKNKRIALVTSRDTGVYEDYDEIELQEFRELVESGGVRAIYYDESERVFYGRDETNDYGFYLVVSDELVTEEAFDKVIALLNADRVRLADAEEPFKNPELLKYMEAVQKAAEGDRRVVGGVSSILDILKKVSWELRSRDDDYLKLPETKEEAGQYIFLAQGGESPDDIYKFITRDFDSAHLWLHLNSGDNKYMETVVERVNRFIERNAPPKGVTINWAGLNYINTIWQQKMVGGMANALLGAYITVFLLVAFLFRSVIWGAIAMVPITLTISLIYGLIGIFGKPYDMPIAVLSSLTLGLSIDFGIHYIERARQLHRSTGNYRRTIKQFFGEPATAMLQNTLAISIGFVPLFFADLVPYQTVGAFFFAIMLISGFATLIILPAISNIFNKKLFKGRTVKKITASEEKQPEL